MNALRCCSSVISFNSRTREGCDECLALLFFRHKFQFTHPRGVRFVISSIMSFKHCFNSRTREGCDVVDGLGKAFAHVSIHAPARGAI